MSSGFCNEMQKYKVHSKRSETGMVIQVQQEQAVTSVSQYVMRHCAVKIVTCVSGDFVIICICAIEGLRREQTNSVSLTGNRQRRPLKCFSKPAAMK